MSDDEHWGIRQRLRTPYYYYGVASLTITSLAAGTVTPNPAALIVVMTLFTATFAAIMFALILPRPTVGTKNGPLFVAVASLFWLGAAVVRVLNN